MTRNINAIMSARDDIQVSMIPSESGATTESSVDLTSAPDIMAIASELATGRKFLMPDGRACGGTQVVDLFCGAGGLSAGFEILGRITGACSVVAAADYDIPSTTTYEANIGLAPTAMDLGEFAASGPEREEIAKSLKFKLDAPLILVGGPPCQGFTAHRKKSWDETDDRNDLIDSFTDLASTLLPDAIVLENVPELLSARYWPHFERLQKRLIEAGYKISANIHNLAAYGVPQERFRSLVIAARNHISLPAPLLEPGMYRTVRDAIGHLPSVEPGIASPDDAMHLTSKHRASTVSTIKKVPVDGGSRPKGVGPTCMEKIDGFRDVYGRLTWDRPAVTITGSARNPASGRFVHPAQHRGLSLREVALLQGFPDNYTFKGPSGSRYQQVGNAVPPRFAVVLAAHLLTALAGKDANIERPGPQDAIYPRINSFSSSLPGLKSLARA